MLGYYMCRLLYNILTAWHLSFILKILWERKRQSNSRSVKIDNEIVGALYMSVL